MIIPPFWFLNQRVWEAAIASILGFIATFAVHWLLGVIYFAVLCLYVGREHMNLAVSFMSYRRFIYLQTIAAETELQRQQALKIMSGVSSSKFNLWREDLIKILGEIEAKIDFPDEDLPDNISQTLHSKIERIKNEIDKTLDDNKTGEIIEFVDKDIELLQEKIAKKLGYNLVDHKLELYGSKIKK